MGRNRVKPLPRIPNDNSFKMLIAIILALVLCGGLVAYFNYQAADQGGTGATSSHQKRVPLPTVPDND